MMRSLFFFQSVLLEVFQQWCVEAGVGDCVYAGLAYDAVWAILNGLTATLNHSGGDLQRTLSDSNFTGVSVSYWAAIVNLLLIFHTHTTGTGGV